MKFRFLVDHYIDRIYAAGETAEMPLSFVPSGGVDPLDASAVAAFYAAGPASSLVRQRWTGSPVARPATHWVILAQSPGLMQWALTGLGSGLAPVLTGNAVGGPP